MEILQALLEVLGELLGTALVIGICGLFVWGFAKLFNINLIEGDEEL